MNLEGNNGGDFIEVRKLRSDMVRIKLGHQCVLVFEEDIPVEMLTAALAYWHDSGRPLPWDDEYNQQLLSKVVNNEIQSPLVL